MKKKFSLLTVSIIAFFSLAIGVGASAAYINWNGTNDYYQTLENFGLIEQGIIRKDDQINELSETLFIKRAELNNTKGLLADVERELEQKNNQLLDKDNQIEALEKRIENGQTTSGQLEQAEKDMKDVQEKSSELLEKVGE